MKGNLLHYLLLIVSLSLFLISCAGLPEPSENQASSDTEEISQDSSEPGDTPGGNTAEDSEPVSVPLETVESDSSTAVAESAESDSSAVVAEPDETAVDEVAENTVKPPDNRKLKKKVVKPVEPGKPIPEQVPEVVVPEAVVTEAVELEGTDSEASAGDLTQEEPASAIEVPESAESENISSENETAAEESSPALFPANPLLTEDREYRGEDSITREVPRDDVPKSTAEEISSVENPAVAAAAPSRILDNPGEFTITMEGQGWIFRSDRSTPGSWRFMERQLNGNSTNFRFMFSEPGSWNLVFQRQDLSSGGSEEAIRKVVVGSEDGVPRMDNGPPPQLSENAIPGDLPADADSRNTAAGEAQAEGRLDDALKYWEVDARRDDAAGKRARAAIVENAVATNSVNPLITWLPLYLKDNPDNDVLAGAVDVFEAQAGYDEQSLQILEVLAASDNGDRKPEWLYRLALSLEKPGEYRDLDRSASLYQEVITRWPLSSWRDKSEERLLWLQRHYFRVR